MKKIYLTYEDIHKTVGRLSESILNQFNPDIIIAIGTGGFIPARILKTFLEKPVYTIGVSYYDDNNIPTEVPQTVQWIQDPQIIYHKKILLVDEVDDTRATLEYCAEKLLKYQPKELAIAVIHNKRKEKKGTIPAEVKKYFSGGELDDVWIVYPWEIKDISAHNSMSKGIWNESSL